jgi:ribonuclease P protein component
MSWAAPTSRGTRAFEEAMREEDVPAEQSEAEEDPRIPHSDADARRSGGHRTPAQQGSRQPLRLIWRVRDRATFRALARGRRRRSGILEVTTAVLGAREEPPRVAYAIGRQVGNAVVRNRARRRLRAAVREHADMLEPGRGYLVRVLSEPKTQSYRELSDTLRRVLTPESDGARS